MTNASDDQNMIGGYGSDDKVRVDTGDDTVADKNDTDTSHIPGVLGNISPERANEENTEPSGPAGAVELGSNATNVDNLSGGANDYTSGGGTSGFGKGS